MASVPIRSTAVEPAPKDYSIPHAQQIILLSVNASYVDSGAAVDWLPAVVILDNNGNVLVRAVDPGVKVTAGNDAEVSWFPGVKNAGAGFTKASLAQSFISQATQVNQTIASGVATQVTMGLFTSVPAFNPGTWDTSVLPSGQLTFVGFQTCVSTLIVDWPAAAYDRYTEITVANSDLPEYVKSPRTRHSTTPDGDRQTVTAVIPGGSGAPPTTLTATVFQASGVNRAISAIWYNQIIGGRIFLS